jgi:carbamate kinase
MEGFFMRKKKIVIALGHDALGTTLPEQKSATLKTAKAVADFIKDDYQVVISHSNGPQVGMIHTAMSEFCRIYPEYTATPMSVCSAMSQGYIGYDLQNAIRTELLNRGIYKPVSTILTQVTVDPYDDAFYNPTKVIGRVMTEEEAEAEEKKGNHVKKTKEGWRRILAAPSPVDIVEIDAVRALLDADQIVIACGGGGIPVLAQGNKLKGASAVIEKDSAAGRLADLVDADRFVILTGVEKVCLNFGKENEQTIEEMTVSQAIQYIEEGQFGEGTMLPKIQAAIEFIGNSAVRSVLITKLDSSREDSVETTGTVIHK